jgi:TolB-like protein/Flp pilus assembly protein TadD
VVSFFDELKRRNVIRVGFAYAVVGWLVAQVADLALESFGAPDWVMKTLLFLILLGFLIALFIAWAYELTPEGIKRAEDVDPNQSITHQTGRKLDRLVIVVLLVSVGLLLFDRFWHDQAITGPLPTVQGTPQTSTSPAQEVSTTAPGNITEQTSDKISDEPSVAVLPFVNMSSDPEQEYFSDGISEEILNVLTRIPNLKVAARTSSFQFKGKNLDVAAIGKQLQVNHLLEGSVRKSGNTLRITAQLVETETGFHLWSETFDRKLEDVFAIQDEIAAAIALELRTLLSTEFNGSSTPVDMRAYELYLKSRGLVASRRPADMLEGITTLNKALEIEPSYAPAMATLAKAYVLLPYFSDKMPTSDAREQARNWAEKSLKIDAQNSEALAALAIVYNESDINPLGAIELLQRAVKLNPGSVVANNFLGDVYWRTGDFDNAMRYELRAAELDPLGPIHLTDLAALHLLKDDHDMAIKLADRALALDTTFFHAYWYLSFAYYYLGDVEQSERVYQDCSALCDSSEERLGAMRVTVELIKGDQEEAEMLFRQLVDSTSVKNLSDNTLISAAVQLGDFDTAGQLLLNALEQKDGRWTFPLWVRLPEQAPDSEPWQEFWGLPQVQDLVELRRKNGLNPSAPAMGKGGNP